LEVVYTYIKNKKHHHLKKNGEDEFDDFVKLHGLEKK